MEINIEIKLSDDETIQILNNGDIKHTIEKECNEISAEILFQTLCIEQDSIVNIIPMDKSKENNPRFKAYSFIWELYNDIITGINDNQLLSYDVDISDKDLECEIST